MNNRSTDAIFPTLRRLLDVSLIQGPTTYLPVLIATLSLLFTACTPSMRRAPAPEAPPKVIDSPSINDSVAGVRYQIDSEASQLRILVFRGGAMARLGHNHVVGSSKVSGTLLLHPELPLSQLTITLPVDSLVVDDTEMRRAEGEEFAADVPQDARDGTRRNLMRPEVLDAEHFPTISLQSTVISGTRAAPILNMRVTIKNNSRNVVVPTTIKHGDNVLTATGEFTIQQTEFGITPFSVGFGALQVQDTLRIKFSIVCRQQQ